MKLSLKLHKLRDSIQILATTFVAFIGCLTAGTLFADKIPKTEGDIEVLVKQVKVYEEQNGMLPTTEQGIRALVDRPTTDPLPRRWRKLLSEVPVDSWGNTYVLEVPARRSKDRFDLFSKGPDRKAGTADDIGNW
jgi:general secretion pathway protein G